MILICIIFSVELQPLVWKNAYVGNNHCQFLSVYSGPSFFLLQMYIEHFILDKQDTWLFSPFNVSQVLLVYQSKMAVWQWCLKFIWIEKQVFFKATIYLFMTKASNNHETKAKRDPKFQSTNYCSSYLVSQY